jgi:hypothetical protein
MSVRCGARLHRPGTIFGRRMGRQTKLFRAAAAAKRRSPIDNARTIGSDLPIFGRID